MLRSIPPSSAGERGVVNHDAHTLEWCLNQKVESYLAYQTMYMTASGRRALGSIVITSAGTIAARRVTATKIKETQRLRNWMEACVWFDLPLDVDPVWMRDFDEEELWKQANTEAEDVKDD